MQTQKIVTEAQVASWVEKYLVAWRTNAAADITALFTEAAEYHESPYETDWIGRDEIVAGWQSRWDWQQGGWDFDWNLTSIAGSTVVITGVGHYAKLGTFDNVWTVTFDTAGLCTRFNMINTEQGAAL
ncbi:nuclear transport factor 2 family protein [Frondihabitans cladoniiphilus]|uniref:SnoaL-like domain-containing protein n=1 Tax=Frondihabitans cladoniiphilus TaxID=715785 RepID=A0ABP8VPZ3_9MICO